MYGDAGWEVKLLTGWVGWHEQYVFYKYTNVRYACFNLGKDLSHDCDANYFLRDTPPIPTQPLFGTVYFDLTNNFLHSSIIVFIKVI